MDRLVSLSVFVAAVEEGSIAAAGKRFGFSAVMAGRYLSALEEHLSARLVQRTTRRLSLTDAGQAYFARSKRILEDLQEADEEAADRQAMPRGSLHIAAPITFGSLYLGPIAAQ
jgi:DNA-binding transcriptional LysR family regulator